MTTSLLWNEMARIIEQEDVVQVIFKTATGKTITLDAESSDRITLDWKPTEQDPSWKELLESEGIYDGEMLEATITHTRDAKASDTHDDDASSTGSERETYGYMVYKQRLAAASDQTGETITEVVEASSTIEPDIHFKIE